jgi:hypothetical protein
MLAASWAAGHPGEETAGAASLWSSLEAEALRHDEVLRRLLAVAPEEARPGLEHALIVLNTGRGTVYALFIGGGSGSTVIPPADSTTADPVTGGSGEAQEAVFYAESAPVVPATPGAQGGLDSGHVQVEASADTDADTAGSGAAGVSTAMATVVLHAGSSRTPTPTPTPAIDASSHR